MAWAPQTTQARSHDGQDRWRRVIDFLELTPAHTHWGQAAPRTAVEG